MRFLSAKTIDLVSCYWGESIYDGLELWRLNMWARNELNEIRERAELEAGQETAIATPRPANAV